MFPFSVHFILLITIWLHDYYALIKYYPYRINIHVGAIIKRKELYFWPRVLSFLTLECHVYCDTENRFWVLNEDLNFDSGIFGFFLITKLVSGIEREQTKKGPLFLPKCHCGLNVYIFINGIMHHTYHSQKNLLNTHKKRKYFIHEYVYILFFQF